MSEVNPSPPESVDSVSIKSVFIHSQHSEKVDISGVVTDLDVFEHLDKPYVTALLGFVDIQDVVGVLNISGGEKITIVLQSNMENAVPVEKVFYIDKISSSNKVSDNEEFFAIHLIEDIGFLSNLINLNRCYSGKPSSIIEDISSEFFDMEVNRPIDKDQQSIKVIVPNLTPIDAMCWIKNRTTTVKGYPFYLYSTLIDENLNFVDLQSLLTAPVMNPKKGREYTYYESQIGSPSAGDRRRVIMAMQSKDSYDMYNLIDKGLLGSEYQYIDTIKKIKEEEEDTSLEEGTSLEALEEVTSLEALGEGTSLEQKYKKKFNRFLFDIETDVIETLEEDGIVEKGRLPIYDKYRYDWSTSTINSRKITRVGSSKVFDDKKSISEETETGDYRLNERSRTFSRLLTTDPVAFIVHGVDFLYGDYNVTIGNKLRVKVLRNTKVGDPTDRFDKKKSGDYLIFACKHSFTPREYTLTFSGVKLSNGDIT
jgi:hypothetical protein